MASNNSFLESLKVDGETQTKLAEVSKNYNNSKNNNLSKKSADEGDRERGDEDSGSLGREAGLKKVAVSSYKGKTKDNSINQSSHHSSAINGSAKTLRGSARAGHSSNNHGEISAGGHSGGISGGHGVTGGSFGGSNGGHGGSGGGHGGSSGGHGR